MISVDSKGHKTKSRGRTRARAGGNINDDCMELSGAEFTSSSASLSSNESDPGFFTTDEGREGKHHFFVCIETSKNFALFMRFSFLGVEFCIAFIIGLQEMMSTVTGMGEMVGVGGRMMKMEDLPLSAAVKVGLFQYIGL